MCKPAVYHSCSLADNIIEDRLGISFKNCVHGHTHTHTQVCKATCSAGPFSLKEIITLGYRVNFSIDITSRMNSKE
jgi:hypothetical protein